MHSPASLPSYPSTGATGKRQSQQSGNAYSPVTAKQATVPTGKGTVFGQSPYLGCGGLAQIQSQRGRNQGARTGMNQPLPWPLSPSSDSHSWKSQQKVTKSSTQVTTYTLSLKSLLNFVNMHSSSIVNEYKTQGLGDIYTSLFNSLIKRLLNVLFGRDKGFFLFVNLQ